MHLGSEYSHIDVSPRQRGGSSFHLGANHFPVQEINSPLTSVVDCTSVCHFVFFPCHAFPPVGGLIIHPPFIEVRRNHVTCFGQYNVGRRGVCNSRPVV